MSLWDVFLAIFRRSEGDDEEGPERSSFVPSPLDLSVRVAHGGGDDEVERELSKISERARELDEKRRGD